MTITYARTRTQLSELGHRSKAPFEITNIATIIYNILGPVVLAKPFTKEKSSGLITDFRFSLTYGSRCLHLTLFLLRVNTISIEECACLSSDTSSSLSPCILPDDGKKSFVRHEQNAMIANIGVGRYDIIIGNTYEPCVSKVTQVPECLIQVRSIDTEDERVYRKLIRHYYSRARFLGLIGSSCVLGILKLIIYRISYSHHRHHQNKRFV